MTTSVRPIRGVRPPIPARVGAVGVLGAIIALSGTFAGCSQRGSAEPLNSPVAIETHQTIVSLENKSGMPLNDITLSVVAYGNTAFTKTWARMENAERREIALGELSSRDGTVFNARLSKPKLVRFVGTDATGKRYDVETPWK